MYLSKILRKRTSLLFQKYKRQLNIFETTKRNFKNIFSVEPPCILNNTAIIMSATEFITYPIDR